jgi:predicted transcriptional regulator
MSVARVMIDVLIKKGFSISEIAKLAEVDRSAVSHVYHGNNRYSGKKIVGRLSGLLKQTGYTKEEHKRIQDAIYKRTTFVAKEPVQAVTTSTQVLEPVQRVEIPRPHRITNERVTIHNQGVISMKWVSNTRTGALCTICENSIFGATYSSGMVNGVFAVVCMTCLDKYRDYIKPVPNY